MKIAKYVGDLLYNYECVVIPGLGGFLTNDKSATINSSSNLFKPPFKQILFNAYLKTNDGLLVNYIAREEGIEYKEAKEQVDRFVLLCDSALREGKRINFHRIGYLYLNPNQKIAFEQDNSTNYNPDAFGLTGFISPAIYKATPEEKLREKVAPQPVPERKPQPQGGKNAAPVSELQKKVVKTRLVASKRRSPYRAQMTVMSILILVMFIGWGFMHKTEVSKYYSNYSSVIPWIYSGPNSYLVDNINNVPITKMSKSKTGLWVVNLFKGNKGIPERKSVTKTSNSLPEARKSVNKPAEKTVSQPAAGEVKVAKSNTPKNTPATQMKAGSDNTTHSNNNPATKNEVATPISSSTNGKSVQVTAGRHIYIIAGAFKNEDNATKLIQELRSKGYPAVEAGVTKYGLHRVAFGDFKNKEKAEQQLLTIRQKENPSAWIFED
jgi:cell division septation protein DedD